MHSPAASPAPPLSVPPARATIPSDLTRKLAHEATGTALIVLIGCGCVSSAKYLASGLALGGASIIWGTAVSLAVYATRDASGAHLNPAITAALTVHRDLPPTVGALYVAAQITGAVVAAAVNYAIFAGPIAAFEKREGIIRGTPASASSFAGAFALVPSAPRASTLAAEALATGLLAFLVFAVTDPESSVPAAAAPALVGASVTALVAVFGPVTGAGMNPARDLGPRLIAALAGWRGAARGGTIIYTVGPILGAIAGGGAYDALHGIPK